MINGCDTSVISRRVISNESLKPTTQKLFAANGTEIALLGEAELTMTMSGHEVTATVVVSEEVDDLILGIDWLGSHRCRWSFTQNLIEIDGEVVRLINRPRQNMLRRIHAVNSTVIHAGHTTSIPVIMALSTLRQTAGDWAVEPRSLGTGILAARTLMRDEGRRSAIQVMNTSEVDFLRRRGEFIGEAEQVTAVVDEETPSRPTKGEEVPSPDAATPTGGPAVGPDPEERQNDEHIQAVLQNLPAELDLD